MTKKTAQQGGYEAPSAEITYFVPEGVFCSSLTIDGWQEDEDDGLMFN